MLKNILGVIIGYAVMFVFIMVTFGAAYFALGTDGAFQPGTYDVTFLWVVIMIILGFIAAVVGGVVCKAISKNQNAVLALVAVVIVLGIISAIPSLSHEAGAPRPADVDSMTAMQNAQQPVWFAFLNPLIGAAGVMVGGRLKQGGAAPSPEPTAA